MRTISLSCLLPIALLLLSGADVQAQTVTYCDTYNGPVSGFSLTVPRFDQTEYPLIDADIELDITYSGQLLGENVDPLEQCPWAFGLNLGVRAQDLAGAAIAFDGHVEASGTLDVAGGAEPYTVALPLSGAIAADEMIAWSALSSFYADQTLTFTTPSFGGVYFMFGQGVFSWSFTVSAQVCATYTYDGAIETAGTSFGALKAMYR